MNGSTLIGMMTAMLGPKVVETMATTHGLVQRAGGKVKPFDLLVALLLAATRGDHRMIAEVRRQWETFTGETITRSAFDAHFDKPAMGAWIDALVQHAMRSANRALRRQWPPALRALYDVVIDDGTRMRLPRAAKGEFPATEEDDAGVKIILRLSLAEAQATKEGLGPARTHDHPLRPARPFREGTLILRDLGFYDHAEFAAIIQAKAFFISRFKEDVVALVEGHVEGMLLPADVMQGQRLDRTDGVGRTSDVDVLLRAEDGSMVPVRLVRVEFDVVDRAGRVKGWAERWYVTNLPRETWSPDMIAASYRLRWLIERTIRDGKKNARLDHLRTTRPTAIRALLGASLLLLLLMERIHRVLAERHGLTETSAERVSLTVASMLGELLRALALHHGLPPPTINQLAAVIAREARHPNPSQPPLIAEVFSALQEAA